MRADFWSSLVQIILLPQLLTAVQSLNDGQHSLQNNGFNCRQCKQFQEEWTEYNVSIVKVGGYLPGKVFDAKHNLVEKNISQQISVTFPLTNQCHHVTPLSPPPIVLTYMPYYKQHSKHSGRRPKSTGQNLRCNYGSLQKQVQT